MNSYLDERGVKRLRVIAGSAKGHKLLTIDGLATRPTTDRIKETLFNIIAFDLPNCRFLDLFAGSGAIGIEALSRGAEKAVFVDASSDCALLIEENLSKTKLLDKADILEMDVFGAISALGERQEVFDILFLDPPYNMEVITPTLEAVLKYGVLKKDGYVIVEHSAEKELTAFASWKIIKEKNYKTTIMTFLSLEEAISC